MLDPEIPPAETKSILQSIIKAAKDLPTAAKTAVLGGVLIVVVALAALAASGTPTAMLILALVCGTIALLALPRAYAIKGAIAVFTFALVAVAMVLLETHKDVETVKPVVADTTRFIASGIVMEMENSSKRVVENAVIRVIGDGGHRAATDEFGRFADLPIPRNFIRNDSIAFSVYHMRQDTVTVRWENHDLTLLVNSPGTVRPASAALFTLAPMFVAAFRTLALSQPTSQQSSPFAIIIDSIRAVNDGSRGDSHWTFDVDIGSSKTIHLPKTAYNDSTRRQLLAVGAESQITASGDDSVRIAVEGVRQKWFSLHNIRGRAAFSPRQIRPGTTLTMRVPVFRPGEPTSDGFFWFYLTILRPNERL